MHKIASVCLLLFWASGSYAASCNVTCSDGSSCEVSNTPPAPPRPKSVVQIMEVNSSQIEGGVLTETRDLIVEADALIAIIDSSNHKMASVVGDLELARASNDRLWMRSLIDLIHRLNRIEKIAEVDRILAKVSCNCNGTGSQKAQCSS